MEHEIETILLEAKRVGEFSERETVEDDPEGYWFAQGWMLGLTRATEILTGSEALEHDEIIGIATEKLGIEWDGCTDDTFPMMINFGAFSQDKELKEFRSIRCMTEELLRDFLSRNIATRVMDGLVVVIEGVRE